MTTEKAVGEEITLWFAIGDEPTVEGADETESKEDDGWLKKKYQLKAQNLVIKGKVTKLVCSYNSLTSLDVSRNTGLTELICHYNSLTSLDVSKNTELTVLYCSNNTLASLDVSNNTKLKELFCYNNSLNGESLELPALATKGILYFKYGAKDAQMLTEDEVKDIRDNKNWAVRMYVDKNWVEYKGERAIAMTTEEAVGGEIYLKFAPGDEPSVEGAEEKESEERNGWLKKKYQLKAQNLVIKGKVTKLGCSDNKLTSLDVSKNTTLEILDCSYNSLTSLDVSKNTTLEILDCSGNPLTSLDVSKNTELTVLSCFSNSLSSLDVSRNTKLEILGCSYNSLTSLDVRKNTKLTELYCYYNKLTFEKLTLPKLSAKGNLYFKHTDGKDSQKLTVKQVEEIEEKNWTVWQHKGKYWVYYPGE